MRTQNNTKEKAKAKSYPTLSGNTFLRYMSFAVLYLAQGIPEGLIAFGIPAWMAANGKTAAEIGMYAGIVLLPWSFKVVIAPMMDRFTFLPMGRKRPWVIAGQLGIVLSFISFAFIPDPLNNISWLMAIGFLVNFFASLQDVATDGMAIEVIPIDQQARANGLMWGSKIVGISASLAVGTWLINSYNFNAAVLFLSICVMLIMLVPLLMRERQGEKLLPWTDGSPSIESLNIQVNSINLIFKNLFKVFFLRNSIMMGIAFFFLMVGCGLIFAIMPVFSIQEVGWTDQEYSNIFSTANLIGGFLGMFAGGALADFFGKRRMMTFYALAMIILASVMSILSIYWANDRFVQGFILLFIALYVFISVAAFATGMGFCWKRVAATQFTLYMALANLGRSFGSGLLGLLKEYLSWEFMFLAFNVFAVLMIVFIQLIRDHNHADDLERIEAEYLANGTDSWKKLLRLQKVKFLNSSAS